MIDNFVSLRDLITEDVDALIAESGIPGFMVEGILGSIGKAYDAAKDAVRDTSNASAKTFDTKSYNILNKPVVAYNDNGHMKFIVFKDLDPSRPGHAQVIQNLVKSLAAKYQDVTAPPIGSPIRREATRQNTVDFQIPTNNNKERLLNMLDRLSKNLESISGEYKKVNYISPEELAIIQKDLSSAMGTVVNVANAAKSESNKEVAAALNNVTSEPTSAAAQAPQASNAQSQQVAQAAQAVQASAPSQEISPVTPNTASSESVIKNSSTHAAEPTELNNITRGDDLSAMPSMSGAIPTANQTLGGSAEVPIETSQGAADANEINSVFKDMDVKPVSWSKVDPSTIAQYADDMTKHPDWNSWNDKDKKEAIDLINAARGIITKRATQAGAPTQEPQERVATASAEPQKQEPFGVQQATVPNTKQPTSPEASNVYKFQPKAAENPFSFNNLQHYATSYGQQQAANGAMKYSTTAGEPVGQPAVQGVNAAINPTINTETGTADTFNTVPPVASTQAAPSGSFGEPVSQMTYNTGSTVTSPAAMSFASGSGQPTANSYDMSNAVQRPANRPKVKKSKR